MSRRLPRRSGRNSKPVGKTILELEATIDTLRISMEGLRTEMEASTRKTLTGEQKVHALNSDVAQWNKAKSRVLYALPKVKEFIHRSTWAAARPKGRSWRSISSTTFDLGALFLG